MEVSYNIIKYSDTEFRIQKFGIGGFEETSYTIIFYRNKWKCNCVGYKTRGYCKHSTWSKLVAQDKQYELPGYVRIDTLQEETLEIRNNILGFIQ